MKIVARSLFTWILWELSKLSGDVDQNVLKKSFKVFILAAEKIFQAPMFLIKIVGAMGPHPTLSSNPCKLVLWVKCCWNRCIRIIQDADSKQGSVVGLMSEVQQKAGHSGYWRHSTEAWSSFLKNVATLRRQQEPLAWSRRGPSFQGPKEPVQCSKKSHHQCAGYVFYSKYFCTCCTPLFSRLDW